MTVTELEVPPPPWKAPHALGWVDLDEGGRVLVLFPHPPPDAGERGIVEPGEDGLWRWRREPPNSPASRGGPSVSGSG